MVLFFSSLKSNQESKQEESDKKEVPKSESPASTPSIIQGSIFSYNFLSIAEYNVFSLGAILKFTNLDAILLAIGEWVLGMEILVVLGWHSDSFEFPVCDLGVKELTYYNCL